MTSGRCWTEHSSATSQKLPIMMARRVESSWELNRMAASRTSLFPTSSSITVAVSRWKLLTADRLRCLDHEYYDARYCELSDLSAAGRSHAWARWHAGW